MSEIFNCTVRYGYTQHEVDYGEEEAITEMGIITKPGDEIRILPGESYRNKEEIETHFSGEVYVQFYKPDGYDSIGSIQIMKYAFVGSETYDGRWWHFNHAFNGDATAVESVNRYRRFIKEEVYKMGGKYCLYVDDCGPFCYAYDMPETLSMEHLLEQLHVDFGEDFLQISQFMENPPAEEVRPIKYYKAFYDDFKDLA